ncbi:MAG: hypothetical protein JWO44_1627 [Bacteroidetes bacterium]|nr:hypothetical protein [Bacteroidota bacterium]
MLLEDYKEIKDNYNPLVYPIITGIALLIIFNTIFYWRLSVFLTTFFIVLVVIITYHCFRDRRCPVCTVKMKKDYRKGLIPEWHFCPNCKIKINTYIGNENSAS